MSDFAIESKPVLSAAGTGSPGSRLSSRSSDEMRLADPKSELDHETVVSNGERSGELLPHLGRDVEPLGRGIEMGDVQPSAARLARDRAGEPRGQVPIAFAVGKRGLEEVVI